MVLGTILEMSEEKAHRKPRRAPAQLARDRRRIAELYLEGWLQADIAAEVKLSQSTVSNDLKALQAQWIKSSLIDIDEAKGREIAKVDKLEWEYYQAWHRSCENAETVQQKGGAEGVDQITKTSKGQAGDHNFLKGVQWCIERRCKILGVDAPIEQKHSGTGEGGAVVFQFTGNIPEDGF